MSLVKDHLFLEKQSPVCIIHVQRPQRVRVGGLYPLCVWSFSMDLTVPDTQ